MGMITDIEAWNLVIEKLPLIERTVHKTASCFVNVRTTELQSYAVEAAFRAAKTRDPEKDPSAYIATAARRGTIDGLRECGKFYGYSRYRHDRGLPMTLIDLIPTEEIWDELMEPETMMSLMEFINYLDPLPERNRQAVYLSFVERWTNTEIGHFLGVTKDRVWQIIDASIKTLRVNESLTLV